MAAKTRSAFCWSVTASKFLGDLLADRPQCLEAERAIALTASNSAILTDADADPA